MNKKERVAAVLRNETPDCTPALFSSHFNGEMPPEQMAQAHLDTYVKTDMDLIKLMQDYTGMLEPTIQKASDWRKIRMPGKNDQTYRKIEEVIKRVYDVAGQEAYLFQTMYGPMKTAVIAYGDSLMMAHAKEDPEAVAAGVAVIAEGLQTWAEGFLDAGAAGIYYAAQFAEIGRFSKEQWEQLVKPYDLKVLEVADSRSGCYNIVHICGEPDYEYKTQVAWFTGYTGDLFNWSIKDTGVSLDDGKSLFKKPILGGLDNRGCVLNGPDDQIPQKVGAVIDGFGQKGFMLGADCTLMGSNYSLSRVRIAVDAAHAYKAK